MKTCFGLMLSMSLASMLAATETETLGTNEFLITGEFSSENTSDVNATALVSQEVLAESGSIEAVELAKGEFVDGEVLLSGTIDSPTLVTVSVTFNDTDPISISVVLSPDDKLLFRVLQADDGTPKQLMFVGNVCFTENEAKKFTVTGDLSSLYAGRVEATVKLIGFGDGMVGTKHYGSVLVAENGTFAIENEIDEPCLLWILTDVKIKWGLSFVSETILEPQVSISLAPDTQARQIVVHSNGDYHSSLIDSWVKSEEYLALDDAYLGAFKEYIEEKAARREAAEPQMQEERNESGSKAETTTNNDSLDSSQDYLAGENEETSEILTLSLGIPPIKECEHVDLTQVKPGVMDYVESTYPEYFKLQREMTQFRYRALEKIASTSDDPIEALLAVELGAFRLHSDQKFRALEVMAKLAPRLDDDVAFRRLTPLRSQIEPVVQLAIANRNLVPGQKAPTFKLPNLEGVEVSLQQALDSNDVVLVEFWASWCESCIARMPDLKKLHASYKEAGFQVLTINKDAHYDVWKQESEKLELPWLDLGEGEEEGPVSTSYGIQRYPMGYVVDNKGCIVQKDLGTDMLAEFLDEKLGEIPEEVESESTDPNSG